MVVSRWLRRPYSLASIFAIAILLLTVQTFRQDSVFPVKQTHQQFDGLTHQEYAVRHALNHEQIQSRIQSLTKPWKEPPVGHDPRHWPPYDIYKDKDFDPNTWETFEWDASFYANSGVRKLADAGSKPWIYSPYPEYNSRSWNRKWKGQYVPCVGPRGKVLDQSEDDHVKVYPIPAEDVPPPFIGDANATGIDLSICFDRTNRYRPYGHMLAKNDRHIEDLWQQPYTNPDWSLVKWEQLQEECVALNQKRFDNEESIQPEIKLEARAPAMRGINGYKSRTAILIRTWEGYNYTENDIQSIRALIVETSLLSGGEYQVFLFVNVKNHTLELNDQVYQDVLNRHVPPELHDISVIWSEKVLEEWYPKVGDWQVYWSQFMPLQWFIKTHTQFDFIWNWEMDTRYTGNHYAFFESLSTFARKSPRKHAWERSQRYFIPSAHGSYTQFIQDTDRTINEAGVSTVWGPMPYSEEQTPIGPDPPTSYDKDNFEWGVGEEADLITLLPMWDPRRTGWDYRKKIWNFVPGVRPHFTAEDGGDVKFDHPAFVNISRRVYINTVSRLSTRLLHAMHLENIAGRTMQAEMWPATVALHHGLKAIYAPHPIWTDRKWPGWYADAIFNADGGLAAQWSQSKDSVYGHEREHNFAGWSWYFDAMFSKSLYRRWLGWKSWEFLSPFSGIGGSSFENQGEDVKIDAPSTGEGEKLVRVGGHGPMCLPPMLLHPVKRTFEEAEMPLKF